MSNELTELCKHGNLAEVKRQLDAGKVDIKDLSLIRNALWDACEYGHLDLVKVLFYLPRERPESNIPLVFAYISGNIELVKWLEKQSMRIDNYQERIIAACGSGSIEITSMVYEPEKEYDYCKTVAAACSSGNIEIVKMFYQPSKEYDGYRYVIEQACRGSGLDIISLVYQPGNPDNQYGLMVAFTTLNYPLIKWFSKQGVSIDPKYDWSIVIHELSYYDIRTCKRYNKMLSDAGVH